MKTFPEMYFSQDMFPSPASACNHEDNSVLDVQSNEQTEMGDRGLNGYANDHAYARIPSYNDEQEPFSCGIMSVGAGNLDVSMHGVATPALNTESFPSELAPYTNQEEPLWNPYSASAGSMWNGQSGAIQRFEHTLPSQENLFDLSTQDWDLVLNDVNQSLDFMVTDFTNINLDLFDDSNSPNEMEYEISPIVEVIPTPPDVTVTPQHDELQHQQDVSNTFESLQSVIASGLTLSETGVDENEEEEELPVASTSGQSISRQGRPRSNPREAPDEPASRACRRETTKREKERKLLNDTLENIYKDLNPTLNLEKLYRLNKLATPELVKVEKSTLSSTASKEERERERKARQRLFSAAQRRNKSMVKTNMINRCVWLSRQIGLDFVRNMAAGITIGTAKHYVYKELCKKLDISV